ncbi:hypothetical protein FB567DRAFT_591977 [Paraphoma chrysanthemicola]|uniref:Uncharacterized protein n=1 Tax=Paraphoma chrysanthemicola TaxID=798071 RepID=A0A8K0R5A9_9PLEO|nr:hypothetical protein FB567DRAFT_591977 [Paraphoma chrysanthemicola]
MSTQQPIPLPRIKRSDLWIKAAATLSDEDKKVLDIEDLKGGDVAQAVLNATRKQKQRCEGKQWSFSFKGKQILVRDVLANIISWTEKFKQVVDFAVSMDATGHAALPWACVKFCLEIAGKDFEKYGSMLLGMEFVAREIRFYTLFEAVYLKTPSEAAEQLADTLVKTYASLLQYLASAYTYYRKHTIARVMSAPFSEDGVGTMMTSAESFRSLIERNARLIDKQTSDEEMQEISQAIMAWKEPLNSMAMQITEINDVTKQNLAVSENTNTVVGQISGDTKEILSMLKGPSAADPLTIIRKFFQLPSPQEISREHRDKARKIVPGTATWIFQELAFQTWSQGKKPLLTIRGSPGCGKSYLSTMVVAQKLRETEKPATVGYHYFHDNDESKRSIKNALCAMVYQLAEQNAKYAHIAARKCDQSPDLSALTYASIWDDFFASDFDKDSVEKACLVFDGIDEAVQEDVAELVSLLHESFLSDTQIQVLLVGRPEMEAVTSRLDNFTAGNIDVSSKLNSDDISRFIDYSYTVYLSKHKIRGLRETVTTSLREKANGMFLWVDLVCQELAKIKNIKVLKQHLDSMPVGLSALYENIFSRIAATGSDSNRSTQLRELFCCLSQFKEPPSVFLLNQIIQYATDNPEFDVETVIVEACASLLTCEETGQLLFQSKIKSESSQNQPRDSVQSINGSTGCTSGAEDDFDSESFVDEETDERQREDCQKETKVRVRHASVGDFLNSKALKTSAILFSREDAAFHAVDLSLRIVCEGGSTSLTISEDLWLNAMTNVFNQLHSLSEEAISLEQTEILIERLWYLFNSDVLGKYISRRHSTPSGLPLYDTFDFGFNTDLAHANRQAVQKWIKRANDSDVIHLKPETREWVENVAKAPLQLLVPLTKVCIREWLHSAEKPYELYGRYNFAWLCLVATDLIPPCQPFPWPGEYPSFGSSDSFNFLADLIQAHRTVDMHCCIAKTMAYGGRSTAMLEWNKAIQLAESNGEEERLKELYYQCVLSLTEMRLMECEPTVLQLADKFLAMDSSNYKMHACLGLARLEHLNDRLRAIEGFRTALALEPRDHLVLKALIDTLKMEDDYKGIMGLFENQDPEIISGRIRACIDHDSFQEVLFLAARESGKVQGLVESYENEIARRWTEPSKNTENDPREDSDWNDCDEAVGSFNRQQLYSAGTALLTCRLAFLHQRYRGDSQSALRLWTTVFLDQSEIFGLLNVSSEYDMFTIPMFIGMFAELLYEAALRPDGAVDEEVLKSLERLRYRHDVFQELQESGGSRTNERTLNLFLGNLYRQIGKDDKASELLRQQFERGIELLTDDIDWNDEFGWHVLSKILFACGQKENATIAQFLCRYIRYQPEEEDGTKTTEGGENRAKETQSPQEEDKEEPLIGIVQRTGQCSMLHDCSNRKTIGKTAHWFACMTCVHVQFCEDCYVRHTSTVSNSACTTAGGIAKQRELLSVCSSRHEHIRVPPEGWRLKEDVVTFGGKEIQVKPWLEALRI